MKSLGIRVLAPRKVASVRPDDPWSADLIDRSGAEGEAEAFAAMVCAKDFRPPLAVGVFGDWGSGKSFFMRRVHDAIKSRCEMKANDDSGLTFLRHVVQIRFNAWHYAETNLWASLVDHIFTELDRWAQKQNKSSESDTVFERLATAREWTLEAAEELLKRRQDKNEAAKALKKAQDDHAKKSAEVAALPETWANAAWGSILADETVKQEIGEAAHDLGLTADVKKDAANLRSALELYSASRSSLAAQDWLQFLSHHRLMAILLVCGVLFVPAGLTWLFSRWGAESDGAALAGILAPITLYAGWAAKRLRSAHQKLTSVQRRVRQDIEKKTRAEAAKKDAALASLEEAQIEEAAAAQRLRHETERLAKIEADYRRQSGRARVLHFVRDRVARGDYRQQLSFIATIRRDFDELSLLMNRADTEDETKALRNKHRERVDALIKQAGDELDKSEKQRLLNTKLDENEQPPAVFERIVLYIDDLDRCPPDQVVVVLQAIHLLLAFPLFVVFVAVDVRWLRAALLKQYEHFADTDVASDLYGEQASPGDYLEKIFQIPYWVRSMSAESLQELLQDHMGPTTPNEQRPQDQKDPRGADQKRGKTGTSPSTQEETSQSEGDGRETEETGRDAGAVALTMSAAERDFITELAAGLDGSPRRALRFINSYHLIKASLQTDYRAAVDHEDFSALLTLLAIQIGVTEDLGSVIGELSKLSDEQLQTEVTNSEKSGTPYQMDPSGRLATILKSFVTSGGAVSDLKAHLNTVQRFSFRLSRGNQSKGRVKARS